MSLGCLSALHCSYTCVVNDIPVNGPAFDETQNESHRKEASLDDTALKNTTHEIYTFVICLLLHVSVIQYTSTTAIPKVMSNVA